MAWCCCCGVLMPSGDCPNWMVLKGVTYHNEYSDFVDIEQPKRYLCPDCAGSVRAWLGVD